MTNRGFILGEFTIDAYIKYVVYGEQTVRDFIQSCFWGGDEITNESEYEMIKNELQKYA